MSCAPVARPPMARSARAGLQAVACVVALVGAVTAVAGPAGPAQTRSTPLPVVEAAAASAAAGAWNPAAAVRAHEGLVEPVRQTTVAAQVAGAVVELRVQVGERVRAGQLLLRLDAQAARQADAASLAQVEAARAQADLARRDLQRQQQLQHKQFISAAALERAQAATTAAEAQLAALQAQARLTRTQSAWTEIRAPYDAVVAAVPVAVGDLALPGRALLQLHDPRRMRVSAALPLSVLAGLAADAPLQVEIGARRLPVTRWQRLPQADAASLTQTVRAELPPDTPELVPGMVARLWLPAAGAPSLSEGIAADPAPPRGGPARVTAPAAQTPAPVPAGASVPAGGWRIPADAAGIVLPVEAVVRRGELTAVQVFDGEGRALLRQVRLGRAEGGWVGVLAGLRPGEVVRLPAAAAALGAARPSAAASASGSRPAGAR